MSTGRKLFFLTVAAAVAAVTSFVFLNILIRLDTGPFAVLQVKVTLALVCLVAGVYILIKIWWKFHWEMTIIEIVGISIRDLPKWKWDKVAIYFVEQKLVTIADRLKLLTEENDRMLNSPAENRQNIVDYHREIEMQKKQFYGIVDAFARLSKAKLSGGVWKDFVSKGK